MTSEKERISVRTTERRAVRKKMFEDWFTIAVLLAALKLAGAFVPGWSSWLDLLAILCAYIVGDLLWLGAKTLFRRS